MIELSKAVALAYIQLYAFLHIRLGFRPYGLGVALRLIKRSYAFEIFGRQFYFHPKCASAYGIMPAGLWNEPETHRFFDRLWQAGARPARFIDVGASIGEMVVDVAGRPGVEKVFAFEPQSECAEAIAVSIKLCGYRNVFVRQLGLAEQEGRMAFSSNAKNPMAASLMHNDGGGEVLVSTLDVEMREEGTGDTLMLLDVEGAELKVLQGARRFIKRTQPLIVFEWNETSKQFFSLEAVIAELGVGWEVFRLRADGRLDKDFTNTWNCVAIPHASRWSSVCAHLAADDRLRPSA